MTKKILVMFFIGILAFVYRAITPPPPRICGSSGGPPITSPRIKLSDGRHLAYKEQGVAKDQAKYKIVFIHGFDSCKHDVVIAHTLSHDVMQSLGIYIVSIDRPGYGESDPHPKRTPKTLALDIEELADQLELGSKFYVIGFSMGGQVVWGLLKYIPHRLAGAALLTPVINYWWPGFPSNLSTKSYYDQLLPDQWALRVFHYLPLLSYWWNTQKYFPSSSVAAHSPDIFLTQDTQLAPRFGASQEQYRGQIRQQGEFESLHRDGIVGFGTWEFDPMDLKNPFDNVHLWQGDEDGLVPVILQRYIAKKLPWIKYHEIKGGGHLFPYADGMIRKMIALFGIVILALIYKAIMPPPPKKCGSHNGPPITAPRVKLSDGRYLAYKENGVPRDQAKHKFVFIHGFDCVRHDVALLTTISPEVMQSLGIYIVSIDRPGYGESDPHPKRTPKTLALDIEELADQLELGSKFYVIGFSMGGQAIWGLLKYIPHRLAGAILLTPVTNYWWGSFPANLTKQAYYEQLVQDQWTLRISHYLPWLTYWWNTQKWFPSSSVATFSEDILFEQDRVLMPIFDEYQSKYRDLVRQQGEYESIHRDIMIGFGTWEFDPMELENPFPNREGSVHIWQGDEDGHVPVLLQRHIAKKLPWIHYHEMKGGGHMFPWAEGMGDKVMKTFLLGEPFVM
ncbi:hypothetical protein BC332_22750 [Capsicum chinense]|nr:hypothetical protein BC332_22750 [Capsicum chinense]